MIKYLENGERAKVGEGALSLGGVSTITSLGVDIVVGDGAHELSS